SPRGRLLDFSPMRYGVDELSRPQALAFWSSGIPVSTTSNDVTAGGLPNHRAQLVNSSAIRTTTGIAARLIGPPGKASAKYNRARPSHLARLARPAYHPADTGHGSPLRRHRHRRRHLRHVSAPSAARTGPTRAHLRGRRRCRRHLVLEPLPRRAVRLRVVDVRLLVLRRDPE